jgi:uncharacterized membrane protein
MKILWFILAIMFLVFAFLQINDPDPVVWILIYGAMAVTCVLAMFKMYYPKIMIALAVIYVGYSILLVPGLIAWWRAPNRSLLFDDLAKMEHLYIEESREFLGLMICLFVLGLIAFQRRK